MSGWIKLHRSIIDHWIFEHDGYLKAWITMLMTVNHEPKKVLIHGELIDCNRGQSLLSLNNWANTFGRKWTIKKVRIFFDLLKKENMIVTEGLQKTTRLTICEYASYQDVGQTEGNQKADKRQTEGNEAADKGQQLKNDKNYKNEKKKNMSPIGDFEFEKSILSIIQQLRSNYLQEPVDEYKVSDKRISQIRARKKEFDKMWPGRDFQKACQFTFEFKAKQWFGTDTFAYFKPDTLLSNKFLDYLEDAKQNKGEPYRAEPKTKEEKVVYSIPK